MPDNFTDAEEVFSRDFTDKCATFGDRVAAAREKLGLSQVLLAHKIGVNLVTLRGWEDDRAEPRANRLQMLAGVLNVSIIWLMSGEGEGMSLAGADGADPDLAECLGELRGIRLQYVQISKRLGRLEKRIRALAG